MILNYLEQKPVSNWRPCRRCPRKTVRKCRTATRMTRRATQRTDVRAGDLQSGELPSFVDAFRQASPYIVEHAESVFVAVIPGEVTLCAQALG